MKRLLVLACVLAFIAAAGTMTALLLAGDASKSAAGTNRIIVVKAGSDSLPVSDAALASRGARIFKSWSDARAAVDETTKAIILTDSALAEADSTWLRDSAHAGMVIGAFNVSPGGLAAAVGLHDQLPAPEGAHLPPHPDLDTARFGDGPFFSLVLDVRSGNYITRGGMVESFVSADQFLAHVERYIGNAATAR